MKYSDLTHCEFHDLVKRGEAAGLPPHPRVSWMRGPEGKDADLRFLPCGNDAGAWAAKTQCATFEDALALYERFKEQNP